MMLRLVVLCCALAGCASHKPQVTVLDEPRSTTFVRYPAGHGASGYVSQRCVETGAPSHVEIIHRMGAGCQLAPPAN